MKFDSLRDRIFVALDVPGADEARALVERIGDEATSYKIGLQLFCKVGPGVVSEFARAGKRVFLDLKFHDIPNTVAGAVRSVAGLGAAVINVHCSGGPEMMQAAAETAAGGMAVIGVTVLTSLDDENLKELGFAHTVEGQVLQMARLAGESGLDGVVCSPKEIGMLRREMGDDFLLVSPGIRPDWAAKGDQKRIMTPSEAFRKGASALVIGRPITGYDDPAAAMRRILDECA